MNKIKNLVKRLLGIASLEEKIASLQSQLIEHKVFVNEKVNYFTDHTRVDADIGPRGNCTVILTGIYKNKPYVRFYDLPHREFVDLVERFKHMKKDKIVRNIDFPYYFDKRLYF